jgi:hypothetical protein
VVEHRRLVNVTTPTGFNLRPAAASLAGPANDRFCHFLPPLILEWQQHLNAAARGTLGMDDQLPQIWPLEGVSLDTLRPLATPDAVAVAPTWRRFAALGAFFRAGDVEAAEWLKSTFREPSVNTSADYLRQCALAPYDNKVDAWVRRRGIYCAFGFNRTPFFVNFQLVLAGAVEFLQWTHGFDSSPEALWVYARRWIPEYCKFGTHRGLQWLIESTGISINDFDAEEVITIKIALGDRAAIHGHAETARIILAESPRGLGLRISQDEMREMYQRAIDHGHVDVANTIMAAAMRGFV